MPQDADPHWITIGCAAGVGGLRLGKLLAEFGSPQAVLNASANTLRAAGATDRQVQQLRNVSETTVAATRDWLDAPHHHLIHRGSPHYPAQLATLPDPPAVLFAIGDTDLLTMPSLAMVGSRNPTSGGAENARRFAAFVAARGLAIVSGLAAGIDTAAHEGALSADGATIAVLGSGIDQYYPSGNKALQQTIARDGVVISEYPPGHPPASWQFPARNRIISGLSLGTLVVEATRRSGSLITARLAGEQGRSIFAIPGSIHNPLARGCHQLIRQGALLVEQADDIFAELGPALSARAGVQQADQQAIARPEASAPRDPDYDRVLAALGWDPLDMDTLVQRSGLTSAELSSMLLIMELDGLVQTMPGGGYQRRKQPRD